MQDRSNHRRFCQLHFITHGEPNPGSILKFTYELLNTDLRLVSTGSITTHNYRVAAQFHINDPNLIQSLVRDIGENIMTRAFFRLALAVKEQSIVMGR